MMMIMYSKMLTETRREEGVGIKDLPQPTMKKAVTETWNRIYHIISGICTATSISLDHNV